jgi:hypothetical protein
MSLKKQNIHSDLKTALRLKGISLSCFAKKLTKPNGDKGITHTALIRVAQDHETTPWIRTAIEEVIRDSKATFPEYWRKVGAL